MVHMEFDNVAEHVHADESAAPAEEEELVRTESQILKGSKINSVLERLAKCKDPIVNLQRTVSELSAAMGQDSNLERSLSQAHTAAEQRAAEVDAAVKAARNLGEDLLEDMLMLDKLSGLAPESRTKRKSAINSLESLLDSVDSSKDRLSRKQKELKTRLETTSKQLAEREAQKLQASESIAAVTRKMQASASTAAEQNTNSVTAAVGDAPPAQTSKQPPTARPGRTAESDRVAPARAGNAQVDSSKAPDAVTIAALLPLPPAELWRQQMLPVHFESHVADSAYEIAAQVPGLQNEDVRLRFKNASFTVRGVRLPSQLEAEQMRQQLAERLVLLDAPVDRLSAQQIMEAYILLGEGRFGYFEETFRLPQDVDVSHARAACCDETLTVHLPKQMRPRQFPAYSTRRSPRLFSDFGGYGRHMFF
eukprot:TRINITY_DN82255_c0_g1_i1.p1 TRINITY_DN82255_c0_g1~~TRINITY_DN82255_c0_g1_i1.p1  ORF type:complete len:457 (+),score=91.05 TRINITY_DN82255_c0_g1_i1:107-1372(+)